MILTIDFETYYSNEFSLTKQTTEEYIRSDLFETIGVSVKVDDAPAEWFSGTHAEIKNWLQQFAWDKSLALAHNTMFDGAILSWVFDIHPNALADTLSMARAVNGLEVGGSLAKLVEHYGLGEKGTEVIKALGKRRLDFSPQELAEYGAYCVNDTNLTFKLFKVLSDGFPRNELKLIDLTLKMFTEPVLDLDALLLENHLADIQARKEKLLLEVVKAEPHWTPEDIAAGKDRFKKAIMSNPQFADLLKSYGVTPPTKISPKTGKITYAFAKTDDAMKWLLEHPNVDVQTLVSARLGVKSTLEETRTERFLSIAGRGLLPIPLKYFAAHTSRWGGTDKINLQNLPSRGADAGQLKRAIRAPKGYVIIDADSSQIEARTLAWMAGQHDLVEAFRMKKDIYSSMAAIIHAKPPEDVTKEERFIGKTAILGCGYGMGAKKFQLSLGNYGVHVTFDKARHIITAYRDAYPHIPLLWDNGDRCLAALLDDQSATYGVHEGLVKVAWGMFHTPLGLPFKYHELRRHRNANGEESFLYTSRTGVTSIWGGKVTENIIQHLSRTIIGEQMIRIAKRYRVVLTVHDAIACIAPVEEADTARAYVEECLRWTPAWATGLPLNCESGIGNNYGEC